MRWIFDQCIDTYGLCIRQYIFLALCTLISIIAIWSSIKTYKKQNKVTMEIIPLLINFITTFSMILLLIFAEQLYNTHLIIMLIEIYSYFLITYAFTFLYFKSNSNTKSSTIRLLNWICIVFTIGIVLTITLITLLSYFQILKCSQNYWIGTFLSYIQGILILFVVQVPIYVIMLYYCSRTKQKVYEYEKKQQKNIQDSSIHLFKQEDSYVRLKILQTNLLLFTFTITLILHIIEIILYKFANKDGTLCYGNNNQIIITNQIQMTIISLGIIFQNLNSGNFTQLFPHAMIPLIFWYIPNKLNKRADTLYIAPKLIQNKTNTALFSALTEKEIHKKLLM